MGDCTSLNLLCPQSRNPFCEGVLLGLMVAFVCQLKFLFFCIFTVDVPYPRTANTDDMLQILSSYGTDHKQCCGTGFRTAGTVTFCYSGTGTGMNHGSGSGFGPVSNIKCNIKVKQI
jgi:hypothetical protein